MNFFTLDRRGTLSYVNANDPRFERMTPGKNFWEEYPDMVGSSLYQACLSTLEDHHQKHVEYYSAPDQSWWDNHIFPDKAGISVYAEDITEKKRLENRTRQTHATLRATLDNTDVHIWSLTRKLNFQYFNQAFASHMRATFGIGPENGARPMAHLMKKQFPDTYVKWLRYCKQVLAGKTCTFTDTIRGTQALYVLAPIREDSHITGISAFSLPLAAGESNHTPVTHNAVAQLKLKVLNTAMNFHFIFSTLSAIQHYILTRNQEGALNYLTDFSRLIRGMLNSTLRTQVRLTDELDLLKRYISLEQLRFDTPFDASVDIAPDVDTNTLVPPLVLQPYVENAIVHGLLNKQEKGRLEIRVKQEADGLLVQIDDNGIGRKAAEALRNHRPTPHASASMHITGERIELMKSYATITIDITDKQNNNQPDGTLVDIRFKTG